MKCAWSLREAAKCGSSVGRALMRVHWKGRAVPQAVGVGWRNGTGRLLAVANGPGGGHVGKGKERLGLRLAHGRGEYP